MSPEHSGPSVAQIAVWWISYHFFEQAVVRIHFSGISGRQIVEVITPDHPGWVNDDNIAWARTQELQQEHKYKHIALDQVKHINKGNDLQSIYPRL